LITAEYAPAEAGEDSEVTLVFQVSDTGQGMAQSQIDKIFEEYTRFNIGINRATVGTGLGMSITKRLIDMMGGEISVESEAGKGSEFTVRLPQKRTSPAVCGAELSGQVQNFRYQSTSIMKKAQVVREYMPYGNVLVVDDIESNLFVAKGMLQLYGLQVETASSGFQAVDKIRNGAVSNIVFMAHMMPEMNGLEAGKIIRDLGYEHSIVALTANAIIGQADMFMANGFDGFISKPIDSRELNACLNSLIRDKQPPEVVEEARREQREKGSRDTAAHGQKSEQGSELKKFFISDAEKAVNVLEDMYSRLDAPGDEELESYIIAVHGMKSALANIGEKELSGMALKLERAGKDRDFEFMSDKTPAFVGTLRALIERFRPEEKESGGLEVSGEVAVYLREKLLAIKAACLAFEKDAAKTALNELNQKTWPRHVAEVLDEISVHLLHSAFKKAVAVVEKAVERQAI
jgi:CheY-like chemotaxis protein/HPt (histidine-containing phosphotransfer) domain-containing protein